MRLERGWGGEGFEDGFGGGVGEGLGRAWLFTIQKPRLKNPIMVR